MKKADEITKKKTEEEEKKAAEEEEKAKIKKSNIQKTRSYSNKIAFNEMLEVCEFVNEASPFELKCPICDALLKSASTFPPETTDDLHPKLIKQKNMNAKNGKFNLCSKSLPLKRCQYKCKKCKTVAPFMRY